MAALVSEYTLEFFTLLNARGKKELIEWCMKEGLIASSYECPKCNEQMGLNERKSVVLDGFEWRCRKKGTGKLEDGARAGRPCLKEARAPCIAVEMEAIASEAASGTSSASEAARRLGLPPSSVRNILLRILQLYPYKLKSCHELCQQIPNRGKHLRRPFFFETQCPVNGWITETVNAQHYLTLLRETVVSCLIQRGKISNATFMEVRATSHTANPVQAFLIQMFGEDRIISRRCRYPCPPRSPDLTPTGFWLWEYLKSHVYLCGPSSLSEINCDENKTVVNTSLKSVQTSHDVNLRITQAFSHIGKGYSAIEKFCMVMNIDPFSSTTYGKCARRLDNAYTLASENIFAEIHREIKNVYENGAEITDLSVSFDGTWLTRGHTSLIGVGCVIDMLTGYVVDFEVMSKVCRHCSVAKNKLGQSSAEFSIWYEGHKSECDINHLGSSTSMEMEAALTFVEKIHIT
ncbi:uncharacterized protein TNCV_3782341 [Trichonephila clavipes]|nr:uncharacterized protein TNCV_3782341 [Trichonephila clavipes]